MGVAKSFGNAKVQGFINRFCPLAVLCGVTF